MNLLNDFSTTPAFYVWLTLGGFMFAWQDLRTFSVSAWPFDLWLTGIVLLASTHDWAAGLLWLLLLLPFALLNGLGSADLLAIIAISIPLGFTLSLIWVLVACLLALPFAWHSRRIPFLVPLMLSLLLIVSIQKGAALMDSAFCGDGSLRLIVSLHLLLDV